MKKHLGDVEKGKILALWEAGRSYSAIAEALQIPRSTISSFISRYKERQSTERSLGSGRPSLLVPSVLKEIGTIHQESPKASAPEIRKVLQEKTNTLLAAETVRTGLKKLGVFAYSPLKRPVLTKNHKLSRFGLCTKWSYQPKEFWQSVIFSDECKFNLITSDGCVKVWREPDQALDPRFIKHTVKHGGGGV
jgi:transposase